MRGGWVTEESGAAVVWSINLRQGWLLSLEIKRDFKSGREQALLLCN